MGFFSRGPSIEQQLKEVYVPMLMKVGHPIRQTNEIVSGWLQLAKEEARKEGTENLPQNYEDHLLKEGATNPKTQAIIAKLHREGVTDGDIRNWWNLHDLERRIMLKHDENTRLSIMIDQAHKMEVTAENKDAVMDKAAAHVRKYCPIWGDPDDHTHVSGDDRPLPVELTFRINLWQGRRHSEPSFKEELDRSTSYNALVRSEIAKGNL